MIFTLWIDTVAESATRAHTFYNQNQSFEIETVCVRANKRNTQKNNNINNEIMKKETAAEKKMCEIETQKPEGKWEHKSSSKRAATTTTNLSDKDVNVACVKRWIWTIQWAVTVCWSIALHRHVRSGVCVCVCVFAMWNNRTAMLWQLFSVSCFAAAAAAAACARQMLTSPFFIDDIIGSMRSMWTEKKSKASSHL